MSQEKLVIFDVEGVLIPNGVYLFRTFLHHRPWRIPHLLFYGLLYYTGLLTLQQGLKKIYRELRGVSFESFQSEIENIELKPGSKELFHELGKLDSTLMLMSAGIPVSQLDHLSQKLAVPHIVGPKVEVIDGYLTGVITGKVIEKNGKNRALHDYLKENNMETTQIISVADDRNNISLFESSNIGIGYNPDFFLRFHADHIVSGSLTNLLSLIDDTIPLSKKVIEKSTVYRKTVHASSVLVPYFLADRIGINNVVNLLILAIILYTVSETSRLNGKKIPIFTWFTGINTTKTEASEFVTSPLFFALGLMLPLILFPRDIAFASIAVLTLGDSFAAIIGMSLGKHTLSLNREKTVEGTLAGFLAAFIGASVFLPPTMAFIAAFSGMITEALPTPVNDNLLVPLVTGYAVLFCSQFPWAALG